MKERPILFQGAMVRAILDGSKTQTRRPLYVVTKNVGRACFDNRYPPPLLDWERPQHGPGECFTLSPWRKTMAGDRLWGREAWRAPSEFDWMKPSALPIPACGHLGTPVVHEATRHETVRFGKLRPSMFMPRWACRLHLDVREVRIERLQKISEADAIAEGIESDSMGSEAFPLWRDYSTGGATVSAQHSYRTLWEMINGPGSWAATPWVVVISFQKVP